MAPLEQQDPEAVPESTDSVPDRPQRIPVPPIMLWGAMWLVAISVTIAATMTLLLPRRLNQVPESVLPSPTDQLAQFDATDGNGEVDAPPPPPETAETPASEPEVVSPELSPEPAPLIPSPEPTPVFPLRLLMLVTAGCAVTSLVVTLILRMSTQRHHREELSPTMADLPEPFAPEVPLASPRFKTTSNHYRASVQRPNVMILPPEAVTPLDEIPADELGDLAAQLDIRRRYSLSALIEDELDSQ